MNNIVASNIYKDDRNVITKRQTNDKIIEVNNRPLPNKIINSKEHRKIQLPDETICNCIELWEIQLIPKRLLPVTFLKQKKKYTQITSLGPK